MLLSVTFALKEGVNLDGLAMFFLSFSANLDIYVLSRKLPRPCQYFRQARGVSLERIENGEAKDDSEERDEKISRHADDSRRYWMPE